MVRTGWLGVFAFWGEERRARVEEGLPVFRLSRRRHQRARPRVVWRGFIPSYPPGPALPREIDGRQDSRSSD